MMMMMHIIQAGAEEDAEEALRVSLHQQAGIDKIQIIIHIYVLFL